MAAIMKKQSFPIPKVLQIEKMRAVVFEEHGDFSKLEYTYIPVPDLKSGEVLIKVHACALNHLDIWNLQGSMRGAKIEMPHIPGCDISGEIAKVGSKVSKLKKGQRVVVSPGVPQSQSPYTQEGWDSLSEEYKIIGFQLNGGFAEYVKVPEKNVIRVSSKLNYEEWASIPLVFLTAWHMLVTRAGIKKGEKVLIHAAGSGVGSAGIQIAKHFGATVITTVGSDEKINLAKKLGADLVINYRKKDFSVEVLKYTHGEGVDVVLEHIGPETFPKSLQALKKRGRLVTCGVTSGPVTPLDLRFLFVRQLSVLGSYMGGFKELKEVIRLVEKKRLRPVIDRVFPLRQAREALERMQNRQNFGKIILVP